MKTKLLNLVLLPIAALSLGNNLTQAAELNMKNDWQADRGYDDHGGHGGGGDWHDGHGGGGHDGHGGGWGPGHGGGYPPPPPPPPYYPPGPAYPPPPPPYYPPAPPAPPASDYLYQNVNQALFGDNVLALRQILGIGPQYRGRTVEYVVLRARTDAGFGQASLLVNGYTVGASQTVSNFSADYYFYPDRANARLDDYIQSLQIALHGRFVVDAVGVKLANNYSPNPGYPGAPARETAFVGRNFRMERLNLASYVNLSRYSGYRVRSVTIRASTAAGRGDATFCSSRGCSTAQDIATYTSDYTFNLLGENVDYNTNNWFFDLRGNFWVESISVELDRY